MSEPQDAGRTLEQAEQAAMAGDLPSADRLLREAARIQESQLGPLHPDLANTLNNLAVVSERLDRFDEAESFYRRAASIASAALPPDDPMVLASRQNLEDFCRARGLSIDAPEPSLPAILAQPGRDTQLAADASPVESVPSPKASPVASPPVAQVAKPPTVEPPVATHSSALGYFESEVVPRRAVGAVPPGAKPPASRPPVAAPQVTAPPVVPSRAEPAATPAPGTPRAPVPLAWVAAIAIVLAIAAIYLMRPSSPAVTPAPAASVDSAPTAPSAPARSADPVPAPPVATPAPPSTEPTPVKPTPRAAAPARSARAAAVASAQLCSTFSTAGDNWRCTAASEPAAPGPLVFLTRVKSPQDGAVVHRWYRGDVLRQSVRLGVRANGGDGYRTYSRQTVNSGAWRLEVRSADGDLLHEQTFTVR